jgi:hypothetical protein
MNKFPSKSTRYKFSNESRGTYITQMSRKGNPGQGKGVVMESVSR